MEMCLKFPQEQELIVFDIYNAKVVEAIPLSDGSKLYCVAGNEGTAVVVVDLDNNYYKIYGEIDAEERELVETTVEEALKLLNEYGDEEMFIETVLAGLEHLFGE
jgi:hypothetical protein